MENTSAQKLAKAQLKLHTNPYSNILQLQIAIIKQKLANSEKDKDEGFII